MATISPFWPRSWILLVANRIASVETVFIASSRALSRLASFCVKLSAKLGQIRRGVRVRQLVFDGARHVTIAPASQDLRRRRVLKLDIALFAALEVFQGTSRHNDLFDGQQPIDMKCDSDAVMLRMDRQPVRVGLQHDGRMAAFETVETDRLLEDGPKLPDDRTRNLDQDSPSFLLFVRDLWDRRWQHDHGRAVFDRKERSFRRLKMLDGGQNGSQRTFDAKSLGLLTQVLGHVFETFVVELLGLSQQVGLAFSVTGQELGLEVGMRRRRRKVL